MSKQTKTPLGQKVTLLEAREMILEHLELEKITRKTVDESASPEMRAKAIEMNGKQYNAFIFTKELIMRFFDGSEEDGFQNPKSSNYLLVILGAHPKASKGFPAGSFTVLTAGCEKKVEKTKDGEEVTKYYPLDIDYPANEYPPQVISTFFREDKDGQTTIEYFLPLE